MNCDICSARCLSARRCFASLSAIFWRRLASLSLAFRDSMSSYASDVGSPTTAIFVWSVWIAGVFFGIVPVDDCLADGPDLVFLSTDRPGCLFGSWGLPGNAVAPMGVVASASCRSSSSCLWVSLSSSLFLSSSLSLILAFFSSSSWLFRAWEILSSSAFFFILSS